MAAEDSDNALLLPKIGGGGIPAPVLVNPLAAQNAGIQSAQGLWGIREKQAQEAWGQILQQSTDEKGNVDYPRAQALAAKNPMATMGMMSALKDTSGLRGAQITQSGALDDLVTSLSASAISDPSDANMANIRARAAATGAPSSMLAEIDRIAALPVDQRKIVAWQHLSGKMGPSYSLAAGGYPTPTVTQFGGSSAPVTIQPGTPYNPPGMAVGGGVPHTISPEGQAQFQQWLQAEVDIPDRSNPGANMKGTRLQFFQQMGVDPKLFYPGDSGGGSGGSGPAVSPNVSPNTSPNVSPNTSPNVSPNTRLTSTTTTTTPSSGTPIKTPSLADLETQKAGAQQGIALTQRAGLVPENRSNLGSMLADAAQLDTMGAGSAREAYLNSFFQKWTGRGLLGNATQEQIAKAESFAKIANIMAANQMASLGASDARQQLSIGANPHLDLSKLGNEQIIHMLQGNEDAIAAKSQAWEDWKLSHGSGSYAQFQNEMNKDFDLRVFQQRYMSKPEIDAMKAQMKSQGTDAEFIRKVLHARKQGWIQ